VNRREFFQYSGLAALSTLLSDCEYNRFVANPPKSINYPTYHSQNLKKVLLIGIDGVRPDALQAARTPHLDQLIAQSAYSYCAQTDENTLSGPGWSNILTGVWSKKHGVVNNFFIGENYDQYPSLFTRLQQLRPELYTVSAVSWRPINNHIIPIADKKYTYYDSEGDLKVMKDAVRVLSKENPDVMFIHFLDVDLAGHSYGFHPTVPQYLKEIEDVDRQIGSVLRALHGRKNYPHEDWLIICTTDHGGRIDGHGYNVPEDRTIFYIQHGKSIIPGKLDPPPCQVDVVPTILQHLRVPIDPAWGLDGKVRGL